ncbi:hypothetical protein AB0I28_18580 [Phytomonospora sp. NPDC050363]|uniref:hypothetical protein n=1 Tax=Phytomonospora sp. NPDC050363 TaxID=3155642 RepID=UPI0033E7B42C
MPDQAASPAQEAAAALEVVVEAARAHLAEITAAEGRVGDAAVWRAYVALNDASLAYDKLIDEAFGEATPWDPRPLPAVDGEGGWPGYVGDDDLIESDGTPTVISVRHRRDYLVPSQAALLRIAEAAREAVPDPDDDGSPLEGVGDAVLELLHAGGGTLASLEIEELTPLDGLVVVNEITGPVDLDAVDAGAEDTAFMMGTEQPVIGRLDERSVHGDPRADDDQD